MKRVVVNAKELQKALKDLYPLAKELKKSTSSFVNEHLLIRGTRESLLLALLGDPEVKVVLKIPATCDELETIVLYSELRKAIDTVEDDQVELRISKEKLTIKETMTNIEVYDVEDYDTIPGFMLEKLNGEHEPWAVVNSNELIDALKFTRNFTSIDEDRFILSGIYLEFKPKDRHTPLDCLRFTATDGHILGLAEVQGKIHTKNVNAILPKLAVEQIIKLADRSPVVYLATDPISKDNIIYIYSGTWIIEAKGLDGTFPDYRAVLPKDGVRNVIDLDEFKEVIKKGLKLSKDRKYPSALFDFQDDKLCISWENTFSFSIKNQSNYNTKQIFNLKLWEKVIKELKNTKVIIHANGNNRPAVIQFGNYPGYLALIMPMSGEYADKLEVTKHIPAEVRAPLLTYDELLDYKVEAKRRARGSKKRECANCKKLRERIAELEGIIEILQAKLAKYE